MIKYSLFKIKPGKREVWEQWCHDLMEKHKKEGIESIIEEDLIRERCVIFNEGDDSYLFYEHIPVHGKIKKPFNPDRELNREHNRKLHECLERISEGVIGYDFEVK